LLLDRPHAGEEEAAARDRSLGDRGELGHRDARLPRLHPCPCAEGAEEGLPVTPAAQKAARLVEELRRSGISDERVLAAMERVPRELFVPPAFADQAWENVALPIGHGQTISQPFVVALMTQALEVGERMKVLEIGTGCGYQAAILARLCRRVFTIERHRELLKEAEARFAQLRIHNITARF